MLHISYGLWILNLIFFRLLLLPLHAKHTHTYLWISHFSQKFDAWWALKNWHESKEDVEKKRTHTQRKSFNACNWLVCVCVKWDLLRLCCHNKWICVSIYKMGWPLLKIDDQSGQSNIKNLTKITINQLIIILHYILVSHIYTYIYCLLYIFVWPMRIKGQRIFFSSSPNE